MAIRQACSYQATVKMPEAAANYSAILVTFAQEQQNLITLGADDLEIDGQDIIIKLDQSQTSLFAAGIPAFLQVRAYKSQYVAPGSPAWAIDVLPALDPRILPIEADEEEENT